MNFKESFYFGPLCFLAPGFFSPAPGFFFPAPGFFFPAPGFFFPAPSFESGGL